MLLLLEDKTIIAVVAESDVSAGDIVASAERLSVQRFCQWTTSGFDAIGDIPLSGESAAVVVGNNSKNSL